MVLDANPVPTSARLIRWSHYEEVRNEHLQFRLESLDFPRSSKRHSNLENQ